MKEPVTLTLAGFATTIPAGSFRKGFGPFGVYAFAGKIDSIANRVVDRALGQQIVSGSRSVLTVADLSRAAKPVTVGLPDW
ncbi:MAG: hypothetical protein IPK64_21255 [bacterium]|nr:hypothetical protein [bacterium]